MASSSPNLKPALSSRLVPESKPSKRSSSRCFGVPRAITGPLASGLLEAALGDNTPCNAIPARTTRATLGGVDVCVRATCRRFGTAEARGEGRRGEEYGRGVNPVCGLRAFEGGMNRVWASTGGDEGTVDERSESPSARVREDGIAVGCGLDSF